MAETVKLKKTEAILLKSIVDGQITELKSRLEHWKFLDEFDKEDFPNQYETYLQKNLDTLISISKKIDGYGEA